jgi:hypothetical protein
MRSSILARIPGFRQRIIPEPHVPSRGSQARGTRLSLIQMHSRTQSPSYARCDKGLWPNPYPSGVVEGGLGGAEPPLLKFHVDLGGLSPPTIIFARCIILNGNVL